MEDKKKLLNYVKNYQIPQNEIKNEDKHVIVPLQNDKTKHKVHKTDKKKSEKSKKISNKYRKWLNAQNARKNRNCFRYIFRKRKRIR